MVSRQSAPRFGNDIRMRDVVFVGYVYEIKNGIVYIFLNGVIYAVFGVRRTCAIVIYTQTAVSYTHLDVYKRQPLTIPFIAKAWGWEMAFIVIGALGFLWMGVWVFVYDKPEKCKRVNEAERAYILQDDSEEGADMQKDTGKKASFKQAFRHKQTRCV